jgi:hypothetical protein
MLVNDKTLRFSDPKNNQTAGWPLSPTQRFFTDGDRQEQEGWETAGLEEPDVDPERQFTSFDRVPRRRLPLVVVATFGTLLIAGVAAAKMRNKPEALPQVLRGPMAALAAWLPQKAAVPAQAPTPTLAEPPPPAAPPEPTAPTGTVCADSPSAAPVGAGTVEAQPGAPEAAAAVAAAAPPEAKPTENQVPMRVATAEVNDARSPRGASTTVARPRHSDRGASTPRRGMVWSPSAMMIVPTAPTEEFAPEHMAPSNVAPADVAPAQVSAPSRPSRAESAAPTTTTRSGLTSPSQIEAPSVMAAPAERPAPSATEPAAFDTTSAKGDRRNGAPIIE